jgi:tRNA1Val (adenine37-N6)-methyltransferase
MLLGAFVEARSPKKILDVGTGCGVLALMMAQRYPSAKITAIEIDENSCIDARKNFQSSTWSNRLQLIIDDFFQDSLPSNFDLIISNPPFHLENVISINERMDAAKHWSKRNVESFYHKCAALSNTRGELQLIIPFIWYEIHVDYAKRVGWNLYSKTMIHGNSIKVNLRTVLKFKRIDVDQVQLSELTIRNDDGSYTNEYKELTREYHGVSI